MNVYFIATASIQSKRLLIGLSCRLVYSGQGCLMSDVANLATVELPNTFGTTILFIRENALLTYH